VEGKAGVSLRPQRAGDRCSDERGREELRGEAGAVALRRFGLEGRVEAASKPKKGKWYNASHALTPAAFDDSAAWLGRELGLK